MTKNTSQFHNKEATFLKGSGEMETLIRNYEWETTSLGAIDNWPQSLRTSISIIINSKFPMFLFWGSESICFYNDAVIPSLGEDGKHPGALGKSGEEVWPEIWTLIHPMIKQVLSGGESPSGIDQLIPIHRNGKIEDVYWTYSYSSVIDEDGNISGVLVVCTETTAEIKKKQENNETLAFALEAADLAAWDYNPLIQQFTANDRYKEWSGLPVDKELDVTQVHEVVAPEDREKVLLAFENAMDPNLRSKYDVTFKITPPNLPERILRAKGEVLFNDHNIATRFTGTLQDVTEQVTAVEKVKESEQQIRSFVESAPFPIGVYVGREMVIQFANQVILEGWGKGENVFGRKFGDVLPELERQGMVKLLEKVYDTGIPYHAKNERIEVVKNGQPQTYYYNYSFTPLFDANGQVYGIMNTASDITDLKEAHQKAEESEYKYRSLIERSAVATCLYIGQDFIIEVINEPMIKIFGKGHNIIGQPLLQVLPELEKQPFLKILKDVYLTGIPYEARAAKATVVVNKIPGTYYFDYQYIPLYDKDGKVFGILNTAVDVTENVFASKKLEESELRFRQMIEQAPVAIGLTIGSDMIFDAINNPMLRMINKTGKVVIGKPLLEVLPELQGQPVLQSIKKVLLTGEPYKGLEDAVYLYENGELKLKYYNISYTRVKFEGNIEGVLHLATDVTEQVTSRKKLEQSEDELKKFKFMADQARDPFILMREDGSFAYLNEKALEAWGYSKEEAKYIKVPDVDPIYQFDLFNSVFKRAQKEVIPQFETLHKKKDGTIYHVEVNMGGLVLDGKPHMFAIARDITERKRTEEEMALKNQELIHINNDLDNFIYTASHDLKAPILNIEGLLIALDKNLSKDESPLSAKNMLMAKMMQESIERFKKTINSLTDVVKLQKEQAEDKIDVNMSKIVGDVILDLDPMIKASGCELKVDLQNCGSIPFLEKNLRSVVANLLSNAIKYRSPNRPLKVQITCETVKNYTILKVKDNGMGMKSNKKKQLFTMFKRFHSHIEGTGIGLYMIKKMIENAEGRIEVETEEGVGSTFIVYFKR
jgi:PAS domain S-box-containing protein